MGRLPVMLFLPALALTFSLSFSPKALAQSAEEIWQSVEKLPRAERHKKLVEGARKEGEMI